LHERLRPKDPLTQSRFLFDAFWDGILFHLVDVRYIESLVREVLEREKPTRLAYAIADRQLDALFRRIARHLS
jgi:hypothetical protein